MKILNSDITIIMESLIGDTTIVHAQIQEHERKMAWKRKPHKRKRTRERRILQDQLLSHLMISLLSSLSSRNQSQQEILVVPIDYIFNLLCQWNSIILVVHFFDCLHIFISSCHDYSSKSLFGILTSTVLKGSIQNLRQVNTRTSELYVMGSIYEVGVNLCNTIK